MQSDSTSPKLIPLSNGVWCRQAVDNMGWADMGGFTLVVDSLEQSSAEQEVVAALRETCGDQPVRSVVNTHTHPDHVALNPVFERMGAGIVNLRSCDIPETGLSIAGSARSAQVLPMTGTHTREDCVVWFPEERTLFVGDLFAWGLLPPNTNLREGLMERVFEVYDRLIEFDALHVVPGHGPLCGTAELTRCRTYFRWLVEQAHSVLDRGGDPRDAAELPPPEDLADWWRFLQWKHADSVKKIAKAVANGWV